MCLVDLHQWKNPWRWENSKLVPGFALRILFLVLDTHYSKVLWTRDVLQIDTDTSWVCEIFHHWSASCACLFWIRSSLVGEPFIHRFDYIHSGTSAPEGNCHLKATIPSADENVTCDHGVSSVVRTPQPPPPAPVPPRGAKNVVLIIVDDLRPELGSGTAYNQSQVHTPNIDKFAATALTFTQAYCQYSHCSPSRNSFLSGRSPQTTGVYNFIDDFREAGYGANWTALPQFFKHAGYTTVGGGKIYHPNKPQNNDMPLSWDNYYFANGDDKGCRKNETIFDNVCPSGVSFRIPKLYLVVPTSQSVRR